MFEKPFRWNLAHRQQLGRLLEGDSSQLSFEDELLPCCARIIAFAGDADLIFVGRSPESLFDHLSGLFDDTSWKDRLTLLHFSMRFDKESDIRKEYPQAIAAMRAYLQALELDPVSIARRSRSVAFVDLVYRGDTFGNLMRFLSRWSSELKQDWNAVKRKIHIVGITCRTKNSPHTWRWQQHADWLDLLEKGAVRNVSVSGYFWSYLGDQQDKVTKSNRPERWGSTELAAPDRDEKHLKALRLAFALFEKGRSRKQRELFATQLAKEVAMNEGWFRSLVLEVRSSGGLAG